MHKFAKSDGIVECSLCVCTALGTADYNLQNKCPDHPHVDGAPTLQEFLVLVIHEVARARLLYEGKGVSAALAEEVGEQFAAYLDSPRAHVIKEAVQVCAMSIRLALEGDPLLAPLRAERGLDL